MRTEQEMVDFIVKSNQEIPIFNFQPEVVIQYLSYEKAKQFLKEDCTEEKFKSLGAPAYTRENVFQAMANYMHYGWLKAQNHRGISANRTIQKMEAYVFLLGDDPSFMRDLPYQNYGAPILKAICEKYNLPIPEDGGLQRMMQGLPCCDNCDEGCGGSWQGIN